MEVVFFPRQDYPVTVCSHRYGKVMTYTEQSDQFRGGADAIAEYADANGIRVGVFWGMSGSPEDASIAKGYLDAGKMWIDAYSNPTGASGGDTITQEVYEEQRDKLLARIGEWFGIRPVAMSYGYGNTTYADYAIEDFLACRNSGKTGGTPYGIGYGSPNDVPYSKAFFKSKASSSRWYDDAKDDSSFSTRLQQLESDVLATKVNGGWYNNFTHWHQVIEGGHLSVYEDYLDLLAQLNANNDIHFAGYGEAVAYLVFRQLVTKAVMYSPVNNPDSLIIRLDARNTLGVNADLLTVPISIKFSTAGTPLAGKTIKSNRNLVSLGGGEYIVEIPYGSFPFAEITEMI